MLLPQYICKSGKIVDSFVKEIGSHRGFAFVRFRSETEALRAITDVNGRCYFKGQKLSV